MFVYVIGRKSVPKLIYKLYQHLRDEDDEFDDDDDDANHIKRFNKLQELDGMTAEHATVIDESDIIMTFLNNIGKTKSKTKQFRRAFVNIHKKNSVIFHH